MNIFRNTFCYLKSEYNEYFGEIYRCKDCKGIFISKDNKVCKHYKQTIFKRTNLSFNTDINYFPTNKKFRKTEAL